MMNKRFDRRRQQVFAALLFSLLVAVPVQARDFRDAVDDAVRSLATARAGGKGSRENQQAVITLATAGERSLLPLLNGFEDAPSDAWADAGSLA